MTQAATPEKSSNFYLGFLFLEKDKRDALAAVYAFCRHVDDIADSGEWPPEEARRRLEFWREEIERLYAGKPGHEIAKRLAPFVERWALPKEGFTEVVRGVSMDLDRNRFETMEELKGYMFGVAGAVGLILVEIFGYRKTPPEDIRAYAIAMGNAFQLTNIMRDVGADLEKGRIYLPLADIRAAGYTEEEFCRREHTEPFDVLMEREFKLAEGFYREARSLLHPDDRRSMLPAEVMARIYEAVLYKMRREGYRVFFHKTRIPGWRKAALAAAAWWGAKRAIP